MKAFMREMKKEIMEKIDSRNSETEKNINEKINSIRRKVNANSDRIDNLTERFERLEESKAMNSGMYTDTAKKTYSRKRGR